MIQLKDLYAGQKRHEWRCVLCKAHGVGYSATWAAKDFEAHYTAKHEESK